MNESWSAFQAVSSSATPSRETIDFCYKRFHKTQTEMVKISLNSDQNSCLALTDPGMVMVCLWLRQWQCIVIYEPTNERLVWAGIDQ